MKVRSSIKRICGFCQIVRRGKYVYVRCQVNNRHKQRQGFHTTDSKFVIGDKNHCECPSLIIEVDHENCCERKELDPLKDFKNENKLI
jgi:ribosomal protein L36